MTDTGLLNECRRTIFAIKISYMLPILILRIICHILYSGININHRRLFTNLFKIACNVVGLFIYIRNCKNIFSQYVQNAKFASTGDLCPCDLEDNNMNEDIYYGLVGSLVSCGQLHAYQRFGQTYCLLNTQEEYSFGSILP